MVTVAKAPLAMNKRLPLGIGTESRKQEMRMRLADSLIDSIHICLNAHIHGVSTYSLDDTVQSIVHEICRYKNQSAVS